jgi:hypothetical protein
VRRPPMKRSAFAENFRNIAALRHVILRYFNSLPHQSVCIRPVSLNDYNNNNILKGY